MRKHSLTLIALVLVSLVCVGFARGWFAVSKQQNAADHKVQVELTVDPDKAKEDAKKVGEAVKELSHDVIQNIEKKIEKTDEHPSNDRKEDAESRPNNVP